MKSCIFVFPLLTLALLFGATTANAQPSPPPDIQLPAADLEKWAGRLKQFCPREGWSVWVYGNDIMIGRKEPVRFARHRTNPTPVLNLKNKPIPTEAGIFRLRLRFSPLMSQDKYEATVAENAPAEQEKRDALTRYNLKEFSGVFSLYSEMSSRMYESPELLEESIKKYREATKDLVIKPLPTNYSPDYSLTFYQSWQQMQYVYSGDSSVDRECNGVAEAISGYFGSYTRKEGVAKIPFGRSE